MIHNAMEAQSAICAKYRAAQHTMHKCTCWVVEQWAVCCCSLLEFVEMPAVKMEVRSGHYHFILFYHWRSYLPGLVPIDSCCKVLLSAPSATFNEMEEFHHIMKMRHHKPWWWNTSPRPMSANHNNYMLNEKTNINSRLASQNFYQWISELPALQYISMSM